MWDALIDPLRQAMQAYAAFPPLGWVLIGLGFIFYAETKLYMWYITVDYLLNQDFIIMAIDVPAESLKPPKVMEQVLAGLHGAHGVPKLIEILWQGKTQEPMSLEIVGISGHAKFLIRCAEKHRSLVEEHFYAQYPDAEIYEVEDYLDNLPDNIMSTGQFDVHGTELQLVKEDIYPIRTYPEFEDEVNKEVLDPMANILEVMSSTRPGEQMWIQIAIKPDLDVGWFEKGMKEVSKILGEKKDDPVPGILGKTGQFMADKVGGAVTGAVAAPFGALSAEANDPRKKERPVFEPYSLKQFMPQGTLDIVDAIQANIAKTAFLAKIRMVYLAHKEVFFKPRLGNIFGSLKQFNTMNLNGFRPYGQSITKINYFFKAMRERMRKIRLIRNYRRWWDFSRGHTPFHLNTEELATIYHFPNLGVMAPGVAKTEYKKGSAPPNLPVLGENKEKQL